MSSPLNQPFPSMRSLNKALPLAFAAAALTSPLLHSQQTPSPSRVETQLQRAAVRSQEDQNRSRSLMKEALHQYSLKNYRQAYLQASEAMNLAPSGTAGNQARGTIVSDYTTISLGYARKLANDGVFSDAIASRNGIVDQQGNPLSAESVAKKVLLPEINPGNTQAIQFLSDLEQPGIFNKAVTPKIASQREEVANLLRDAGGYAQSGRPEMAMKSYESVLSIDPYNAAARKGMEEIHNSGIKYSDEAYNETRSRLLWQVEKAWERPPRKSKVGRTAEATGRPQDTKSTDQIIAKLNTIIIPKIELSDSPISEAVEYLKQKSVEQDPSKKGVNIFLKLGVIAAPTPAAGPSAPSPFPTGSVTSTPVAPATEPHVTISLTHVPLYVALDYISKLSNLKLKIDPYAVSIVPLTEATDVMVTKEYQVPPTFIPSKAVDNSNTQAPQAGTAVSAANLPRLGTRANAKEYLESQGVQFPQGSSANYLSAGSKLVVRNTRDNIDLIDSLVDLAMGEAPSQIDIQTKFLEINQNNLQELGFDWLLGPFSIGGGVYGSGGGSSDPNSTVNNAANYPFGNPMGGGATMSSVGSLRSGDQAINGNSIDGLLAGQSANSAAPAPGIFSLAGVYTDAQFQLVIRALNQKKGIDLMSAPKVTTKSGAKATVKIVNEFRYPRQYQPPQIPQSTSNTAGGSPPAITPAFPSDFTTENIGVTLETTPTVGPDGYTIDLELNPKVIDFDGFINYGSPINSVGYSYTETMAGFLYTPKASTLTTNTINQPVFSTREVNTFVTVWDGQTVGLGGLISEQTQKVQDKVPFLGDIPLAGRLFRSDADQKVKKNLVIFVTPKILDAEGQPRRGDTEEPEVVKPLGLPQDLPQPTVSAVRSK